MVTCIEH